MKTANIKKEATEENIKLIKEYQEKTKIPFSKDSIWNKKIKIK